MALIAGLLLSIKSSMVMTVVISLVSVLVVVCWFGFFTVNPNEAKVLQFFGRYIGTVHANGLRWANPLYSKRAVSLRVKNFESGKIKVNDKNGNPTQIAAVNTGSLY
ncbi:SPFH domain-containing protein [Aliikangiella maris]|uniref:SPFH domain-containing protein n=2 Tax=Aliikangiella maris TaxID=3162458 RepID=A0ABV2BV36_9GAMM